MKKTDYEYALSIIVPVYNVEKYLDECINSILSQEHQGCEIILVDDGSTDRSGAICDSYAGFPDIKVIHKPNGGLSSARNAGMEAATGDYIAFLDSDDRIASKAISGILNWIDHEGTDVCLMEAINFYPDGKITDMGDHVERERVKGKSREEVFDYLSTRPKYPGSACTKLFRRSLIDNHGILFPNDKRISEDLIFTLEYLFRAETFDALNFPYYEYRKNREGSISASVSLKSFMGMAMFVEDSVRMCMKDHHPTDLTCEYAMSFAAYEYSIMLWQYARLTKEDKKMAGMFLDEYSWVMKYGRSKKTKAIKLFSCLLGKSVTSKMLDVYMSHR